MLQEKPKVSIIVRTCNRPQVLRSALLSVQAQTYSEIETVVIEDGKAAAKNMIQNEFPNMNILYHATEEKVGRSKAGNLGLSISTGLYCNFLDDDDVLYPEHVETLVEALSNNHALAAYAITEESQVVKKSNDPYRVIEKRRIIRYQQPFNKLLLLYTNYLPIQCVLFSRKLFEENGGLAEDMDALEDWDMWIRFALKSDFIYVPKVTSKYLVPYKSKNKSNRDQILKKAKKELEKKLGVYVLQADVLTINKEMDYIINQYKKRNFVIYLKKIRDYLLYRDIT